MINPEKQNLEFHKQSLSLCPFLITRRPSFRNGRGFSFLLPAWSYEAGSSCRVITGAKAVHKAGDSRPDTSRCDSVKSTLKAYLSEAETKATGLIFGEVNAVIADRENTMT